MRLLFGLLACLALGLLVGYSADKTKTVTHTRVTHAGETVYISNFAQKYISDAQIKKDIPAWEHAVNVDFARFWHTTQFKLVFIGKNRAPSGSISAQFVSKGPQKGALAYHWTERGNAPSITVYAGTGVYYGFDNSVSFTHELFELAADPVTSAVNQGYPYDYVWLEKKNMSLQESFQWAMGWFQEVADPVESDYYVYHGVKISDFVTPAWFNDGVGGRYDFLGLCQQPFWIRPGGYAQFLANDGWHIIENFRTGHPADRGFVASDPRG